MSGKMRKEMLNRIKEVVFEAAQRLDIQVDKIILFGSRARGTQREDSDWDLLVVVKEKLSRRRYLNFYSGCIRSLHEMGIKVDLIILDSELFRRKKNIANTVANEAAIEGIAI